MKYKLITIRILFTAVVFILVNDVKPYNIDNPVEISIIMDT